MKKTVSKDSKNKVPGKFKIPEGTMSHAQIIVRERKLTQKEVAECGMDLAQQELQLDQVRKEKKEVDAEFTTKIKDHVNSIMTLSQAIDTGILNEQVECEVYLDRIKEKKYCIPKDGSEPFELSMEPDDFDLLT